MNKLAKSIGNDQVCQAANDNDPGQVVISGHKEAVEQTIELAKAAGAKRAIFITGVGTFSLCTYATCS